MKVWTLIPFLLSVSQSKVKNPKKKGGGIVYALHITPFFAVGIDWISKKIDFDEPID